MKKVIYLFLLALVFSPFNSFAITSSQNYSNVSSEEEILNLISQLQKKLENIRNNKLQCNIPDMDLSIGDGEDLNQKEYVKNLQNFLKEKGYFKYIPTGYFGKLTKSALVNFQLDNGLSQTGELDIYSRKFINTLKCNKSYFLDKVIENKEVKYENKETKPISSVNVSSIYLKNTENKVFWSVNGYSKNGFKVVWSKNQNPTYPTREYDKYIYLSDSSSSSSEVYAFDGSGDYYIRVCEYLGGKCGAYSNEVKVYLK